MSEVQVFYLPEGLLPLTLVPIGISTTGTDSLLGQDQEISQSVSDQTAVASHPPSPPMSPPVTIPQRAETTTPRAETTTARAKTTTARAETTATPAAPDCNQRKPPLQCGVARGPISDESRELRFVNEIKADQVKCLFCDQMLPKAYVAIQEHVDVFHKPTKPKKGRGRDSR